MAATGLNERITQGTREHRELTQGSGGPCVSIAWRTHQGPKGSAGKIRSKSSATSRRKSSRSRRAIGSGSRLVFCASPTGGERRAEALPGGTSNGIGRNADAGLAASLRYVQSGREIPLDLAEDGGDLVRAGVVFAGDAPD